MSFRVLIFGQNGNVSRALNTANKDLFPLKDFTFTHIGQDKCDFTVSGQLQNTLDALKPDIIINPAAYTSVDKAESEKDLAFKINFDAVHTISKWCSLNDASLIHFSTDYVFDGKKDSSWSENDLPHPLNVYGESKLASETIIKNANIAHLIFRTSWIFAPEGLNFFKTMVRLFQERSILNVVDDQTGNPTYSHSLASAVLKILPKFHSNYEKYSGIYHISNQGQTSWFEFSQEIKRNLEKHNIPLAIQKINPITTEKYGAPAKRPLHSQMDTSKLQNTFDITLPFWKCDLEKCVEEYIKNI